jgi:hypothetical protein
MNLEFAGGELLASDSSGKLDISDHDSDSSGVDGAHVGVLEQANEVSLDGFLEGQEGRALESELAVALVGDVLDDSLERKLSDQEVGASLVLSDFSDGNGSRSESVSLLDTADRGLSGALLAGVFPWLLDSGVGLSCGGFSSCHLFAVVFEFELTRRLNTSFQILNSKINGYLFFIISIRL